jgi:hypothetical protein
MSTQPAVPLDFAPPSTYALEPEEERRIAGEVAVQEHLPCSVHDADVHVPRVQVDSAVVFVRHRVESHRSLLFRRWLV